MPNVGSFLLFAAASGLAFAFVGGGSDGEQQRIEGEGDEKQVRAAVQENVKTILEIFRAIEQRDPTHPRELELIQPDVEFHWPPALPYGGTFRGRERKGPTWADTWNPLQPTAAERRMDPRVLGASGNEVVVLYHQRGVAPDGERFDGEVVGLYQLRDGKLSRAQMFYFDEAALVRFLTKARERERPRNRSG